jgi:hypothetical protein
MARDIKTGRMLHRSIAWDEKLNSLSKTDQWFYFRMLPFSDDYGRLTGKVFELKLQIIPSCNWEKITIRKVLNRLEEVGLIAWVENEVIQLTGFDKNQKIGHRKHSSLYPAINDIDMTKIKNKVQSKKRIKTSPTKGILIKEHEEALEFKGLSGFGDDYKFPVESFEEFWLAYPSKRRSNKEKIYEKYKNILKTGVEPSVIMKALTEQVNYLWDDLQPQFTPLIATWLNNKRWELDVATPSEPIKKPPNKMICNSCNYEGTSDESGTIKCPSCKEYDYMSIYDAKLIKKNGN